MENSKRFIEDFVQIEMYLKKYLKSPQVGFTQMVHLASKTNPIIKAHVTELVEFSQLRNAIIHNRAGEDVAIAEPHDSVCDAISKIRTALTKPVSLRKIVKESKVFIGSLDSSIAEILRNQNNNNYSVVPIYDGKNYVGMVHSKSYQKLLERSLSHTLDLSKLNVRDLLSAHPDDDRIVFESIDASVTEVVERFMIQQEKGRSLIAMLITQNGKPNESLLGILTPADLPRLLVALE